VIFVVEKLKKYFCLNFAIVFLLFSQLLYLCYLHFVGYQIISFHSVIWMEALLSFVSIFALTQMGGILFARFYLGRLLFYPLLFLIYFTLFWYHKEGAKSFDFELLENNAEMLRYTESWRLIYQSLGRTYFHVLAGLAFIFVLLEIGWKLLGHWKLEATTFVQKTKLLLVYLFIYVVTFLLQVDGVDELQGALRSAFKMDSYDYTQHAALKKVNTKSYLYNKHFDFPRPHFGKRPNIILLLFESLNGELLGENARGTNIRLIPNFERISREGLLFDNFYGNSVQTDKGMFATLCSLIPTFEKSEFKFFSDRKYNCIPEILQKNGYKTTFFQAYRDLNFANKKTFLSQNGFEVVDSVARHLRPGDKKHSWGWGLQDDIYYQRFFEYMDKSWREGDKPFFVTLLPVSSHMAFRDIPNSLKKVYPNYKGRDIYKNYINALNFADESLLTFFAEFKKRPFYKDTVVIVVGDHSYPAGKHGYYINHVDAYNDTFKTALLMFWEGVVSPRRISDITYSQMDLAPTLMDLAGISSDTHFLGDSLLTLPPSERPIYLVQPFNGVFLAVIKNNYKYIFRKKRQTERLFDLAIDPEERDDLAKDSLHFARLEEMRQEIGNIFINQELIVNDRIWPR